MTTRFRRSHFFRSVVVLVSGTALAQLIPILVMPIVSRLFSPEDFGVLGLFTAFVSVATATVSLSFHLAIVSNATNRTAAILAGLGLLAIVPMSLISLGGLAIVRQRELLGFGALAVSDLVWAWFALVAVGVFGVFRYWQVREHGFGAISRATVGQSVGRVAGQVITGLLSLGGSGLVFAEALGRTFGVSYLGRLSFSTLRSHLVNSNRREFWHVAKEFRKFPLLNMPSSVINTLGSAMLIPLVASSYGIVVSGQFSMGYRVLTLPIAVIGSAVADVFHSQLVRAAERGTVHARKLFFAVSGGLFLAGLLPSIVIMMFGQQIVAVVLGEQWSQAGLIASGLMPWLLGSFAVSPVSRVVMVYRGQELKLVYDLLNIAGIVGVFMLGRREEWAIEYTAQVLGWTQALAYAVYFLLLWRILMVKSVGDSRETGDSR